MESEFQSCSRKIHSQSTYAACRIHSGIYIPNGQLLIRSYSNVLLHICCHRKDAKIAITHTTFTFHITVQAIWYKHWRERYVPIHTFVRAACCFRGRSSVLGSM